LTTTIKSKEPVMNNPDHRIPVTILTGFLGAGKTTLLNRILSEQHGQRIAVIENEFGEVGIDQDLVIHSDEEIFEMNNGCICCTVRGDLIRILGNLMKRRNRFDRILIETTGLADPGPVAQTFLMDDDLREHLRLDGVITLVDARHVLLHLDHSDEVRKQIAFADVVLLNKIDLVTEDELTGLETRIARMNARATLHRTRTADLPIARVLDVGGFDIQHALEIDPAFLEPEYPFEWGGLYALSAGEHTLLLHEGPDPSMRISLSAARAGTSTELDRSRDHAVQIFSRRHEVHLSPAVLQPSHNLVELEIGDQPRRYPVEIPADGWYALFTQHHPDEFSMALLTKQTPATPLYEAVYKPDHQHDDEITSVGLRFRGDLDLEALNPWLRELLATQGPDIFRAKGVLSIQGLPNRVVFQGVHMLFDFQPGRDWGSTPRENTMVFIGRNLNRNELNQGFRACLA
jgi:G3E family GTPase